MICEKYREKEFLQIMSKGGTLITNLGQSTLEAIISNRYLSENRDYQSIIEVRIIIEAQAFKLKNLKFYE